MGEKGKGQASKSWRLSLGRRDQKGKYMICECGSRCHLPGHIEQTWGHLKSHAISHIYMAVSRRGLLRSARVVYVAASQILYGRSQIVSWDFLNLATQNMISFLSTQRASGGFIIFQIYIKVFSHVLPKICTDTQYTDHMLRNLVWTESRTKITC